MKVPRTSILQFPSSCCSIDLAVVQSAVVVVRAGIRHTLSSFYKEFSGGGASGLKK